MSERVDDDAWVSLGSIDELPQGRPVVRKAPDGRRLVVVRDDEGVHAIDALCPHQGYPLVQGEVRDGVLTCAWHNWKFELRSGTCVLGGEDVRRYPTRVEGGVLRCDPRVDVEAEAARLRRSLGRCLRQVDTGSALRDALRLGRLFDDRGPGGLGAAFEAVLRDGAERAPWGFGHPLAMSADLVAWVERGWIGGAEALSIAILACAEEAANLEPRDPGAADVDDELAAVRADLEAERIAAAEARVRRAFAARGPAGLDAVIGEGLLPFASSHLLAYGHGAIYLHKAAELARRFEGAAPELLGAVTCALGLATRESALPPWKRTRAALAALAALDRLGDAALADRAAFEERVLAGEAEACEATLEALGSGVAPRALLVAVAHASAERLARFDRGWERRVDAQVSVLDVSHPVTYAEAALGLTAGDADPAVAARFAILAAAFVGKVRAGDAEASPAPEGRATDAREAIEARLAGDALAAAAALSDRAARRALYPSVAPFAALDFAVRPIWQAHGIKTTEALYRLEDGDPEGGSTYVRALASLLAPRPNERDHRRAARGARAFLDDPRPPVELY